MIEPSEVLFERGYERQMRHRVALRVVALLCMSLICAFFEEVGPHRILLSVLLLVLTPVPVVLPKILGPNRWMVGQSWFDVVSVVTLIWFIPSVWAAGLVIVTVSPAASSAIVGHRQYVALQTVGLTGAGVAAWVLGVDHFAVPLAVAAVMVPLVASYADVHIEQRATTRAHLDDVASSSSAVFWEIDASNGAFLSVSGELREVLGYTPDDLPVDLPSLLHEDDQAHFWQAVMENASDQFVLQCRTALKREHAQWLRLHVRRMSHRGQPVLRGIAFDVTELVDAHEEMRRRAEIDQLTGLANRSVLVRELEHAVRSGRPAALFVLDLDRFKEINDTLGHAAGDEFLIEVSRRLNASTFGFRVVARMGGDEFAIVADGSGGTDRIVALANHIALMCEQTVRIGDLEYAGSVSCGVAIAPMHGTNAEDLLRRADLAMYAAKRSGQRFHVFEHGSDDLNVTRLQLSAEIENALALGQLRLWFQPKVDLEHGAVVGAEGLVRWHHPKRGVLLPGEFIDIVEISRHRAALSIEVIRQGLDFLLEARGFRQIEVAVNICARDLMDPGFAARVRDLVRAKGVERGLILEVTERDVMNDQSLFLEAAEILRDAGVKLSVDDFGTGHSSLMRLHQLPVDELKIDRSFVSGLGRDPQAEIIAHTIVELGRSLGNRVVAEGIERHEEVEILRRLGCHVGQGYLFSPALPASDFLALLIGAPFFAATIVA